MYVYVHRYKIIWMFPKIGIPLETSSTYFVFFHSKHHPAIGIPPLWTPKRSATENSQGKSHGCDQILHEPRLPESHHDWGWLMVNRCL